MNSAIGVNLKKTQVTLLINGSAPCTQPGTGPNWNQGNQVTVTASIPCSINIIGVNISCPGGQLTARRRMPSSNARIRALRRRLRHEGGQVLPMTALMMVVLVGFAALVVDVGRIYLAQRQLQNAVDASALSVAQNMPDDFAGYSTVPYFDGVAPSKNALFGYGVTAEDPVVTFQCSPNAPGYDPNTNSCPADASPEDQPTTSASRATRSRRHRPGSGATR